jgi:hypothetical protein
MALIARLETMHGEERELYVRLNNLDQLKNHPEGGGDLLRFRGYLSKEAFDRRCHFVWEQVIECEIDVAEPVWPQAYAALKAHDPTAAIDPPRDPREGLPPLEADSSAELIARHDAAAQEHAITSAEHEARLHAAERLRTALSTARDA